MVTATAQASPVDLFGFGARAVGMGGAAATSSTGASAAYYNPAGLVQSRVPTFLLGYQYGGAQLHINDVDHPFEAISGVTLGVALPLPFGGVLTERLALGVAFIIPEVAVLAAQTPPPSTPHFPLLDSRGQTVSIMTSMGVRLTESLSIGAGLSVLAHLEGSVQAQPDSSGEIGARVRDTLTTDLAPLLGLRFDVGDFPISLTYRHRSRAMYDLPVEADLGDELPLAIPTLSIQGTAQFDPSQVALEVGWKLSHQRLLALGITYERWSQFENPIAFVAAPESYPTQPAPNFKDTLSLKLGIEAPTQVGAFAFTPRVGLGYEPSPSPEQNGYHNYLDNNRFIVSGGLSTTLGPIEFSVACQMHLLAERTATKDSDETAMFPDYAYSGSLRHGGALFHTTLDAAMEF
ncbi:MAG: outer membrane protein transport protein [Myxococcota bacterium]|nr:outer membrane protein transport protein [Myxococcota bacterium]